MASNSLFDAFVNARRSAGAYGASRPQLIFSNVSAFRSTKRCNAPSASVGVIFGALVSTCIALRPRTASMNANIPSFVNDPPLRVTSSSDSHVSASVRSVASVSLTHPERFNRLVLLNTPRLAHARILASVGAHTP